MLMESNVDHEQYHHTCYSLSRPLQTSRMSQLCIHKETLTEHRGNIAIVICSRSWNSATPSLPNASSKSALSKSVGKGDGRTTALSCNKACNLSSLSGCKMFCNRATTLSYKFGPDGTTPRSTHNFCNCGAPICQKQCSAACTSAGTEGPVACNRMPVTGLSLQPLWTNCLAGEMGVVGRTFHIPQYNITNHFSCLAVFLEAAE